MQDVRKMLAPPVQHVPPGVNDYSAGRIKVTVSAAKLVHKKMAQRTTKDSVARFIEREYPNIRVTSVDMDSCGRYFAVEVEEKEHAS
jgi:hypothetical protein